MRRKSCPLEVYDDPAEVDKKVKRLGNMLLQSTSTIVYTGAGISTAADIPDYRGPKGVWTLAAQGKSVNRIVDMRRCNPTFTHMSLKEMCKSGMVSHILSQNCDGLHLRSGIPHKSLSEVHGNMFIEVCDNCSPNVVYTRPFDCTAQSAYQKHQTGRKCVACDTELRDTIVHFGEVGKLEWPLNWPGTYDALEKAELIVCLGSSLNVLKSYTQLWPGYFSNTKLVIVNLQATPKDAVADLVIRAETDVVMQKLTKQLNISPGAYCRRCDPVLKLDRFEGPSPLMDHISDCICGDPITEVSPDLTELDENPGWWSAEIDRIGPGIGGGPVNTAPKDNVPERSFTRITRSAAKRKAGRPRKAMESEFEQAIRITVVDLIEKTSKEDGELKKRGRRKLLAVEKPGYFKMGHLAPSPLVTDAKPGIADHDWEECDDHDSSTDDDDPLFEIPEKLLENTFGRDPAPSRKKKRAEEEDDSVGTNSDPDFPLNGQERSTRSRHMVLTQSSESTSVEGSSSTSDDVGCEQGRIETDFYETNNQNLESARADYSSVETCSMIQQNRVNPLRIPVDTVIDDTYISPHPNGLIHETDVQECGDDLKAQGSETFSNNVNCENGAYDADENVTGGI